MKTVIAILHFFVLKSTRSSQKQIAIFRSQMSKKQIIISFLNFSSSFKFWVGNRQNNLGFWVANAITHVSPYFELWNLINLRKQLKKQTKKDKAKIINFFSRLLFRSLCLRHEQDNRNWLILTLDFFKFQLAKERKKIPTVINSSRETRKTSKIAVIQSNNCFLKLLVI